VSTAAAVFFWRKSRPVQPTPREAAAAAAERRNGDVGGMIENNGAAEDRRGPGPGMALNFVGNAVRGLMAPERGPTVEEFFDA